ncbi:TonB-dependent receptor [Methyloversatilis sp. XJ19-49]|uniref:TonB-dependent receptor family protein n=1 Tax=Methyloversatilis sp. XJ19-49 TaxID=2963429 RepID=UPI00211C2AA6|nr:TonB-dependent receptor [Methyloversatilis sp. XJ19-49]MCQ9379991.1 TonB-dependent receptor [Methyloversatilis sp. XJ19-49]
MTPALRHTPLALALALIGQCASAEELKIAPTVVITGTRVEQNSFDLPMAIDSIDKTTIQEQRGTVNLSEVINRVPGVASAGKENYTQEQSLTIRGFGARSAFGVRGVKLIADGIPASTPDGQGGTGLFDLASASRIEVLRGPFSALYGNHSGGVVQIFTEDGPDRFTITPSFQFGSYGTQRSGVKFGDTVGNFNYTASVSDFRTDGYRDYSRSDKQQANFKARWMLGDKSSLTFVGNYMHQQGQDPLGLSFAQLNSDRRQQGTSNRNLAGNPGTAEFFGTRRTLENSQGGVVFDTALSDRDSLRAMFYLGNRNNEQYLALNAGTQDNVTASGGVSVFDRDYWGTSLRWTRKLETVTFSVGAEYERADEARKGYRNGTTTAGAQALSAVFGFRGDLKRDERNVAEQTGTFIQGEWAVTKDVSLSSGLRYTKMDFKSKDNFICNGGCSGTTNVAGVNPDDSGSASFSDWTYALGAVWKVTQTSNFYANAGRSFEAPTLIELAYRPDGGAGLNFDLKPSVSDHYEVGFKTFLNNATRLDVAAFYIDSADEIVIRSNENGRAVYQNAGDTSRRGLEVAIDSRLTRDIGAYASMTLIKAEFEDTFASCLTAPCAVNQALTIDSGNKIAGIANKSFFGELTYKHDPWGFSGGLEYRASGRMFGNDTNDVRVGGYGVAAIRGGFTQTVGGWKLNEFARIDNLFDKEYVGSVYINAGNALTGRYYAPASERTWLIGVSASYAL